MKRAVETQHQTSTGWTWLDCILANNCEIFLTCWTAKTQNRQHPTSSSDLCVDHQHPQSFQHLDTQWPGVSSWAKLRHPWQEREFSLLFDLWRKIIMPVHMKISCHIPPAEIHVLFDAKNESDRDFRCRSSPSPESLQGVPVSSFDVLKLIKLSL